MYKSSCFWKPCGIQPVKESWKLLKSAEKRFYSTFHIFEQSLKKVLLVTSEFLGLLVNTLTACDEYFRHNIDNLPLPTKMNVSKN